MNVQLADAYAKNRKHGSSNSTEDISRVEDFIPAQIRQDSDLNSILLTQRFYVWAMNYRTKQTQTKHTTNNS